MKALLLVFLFPLFARAEPAIQLSYYEDKGGTLTADEVASRMNELPWIAINGTNAQFGYSGSRFWVRARLRSGPGLGADEPWVLEVPYVYNERLGIYRLEGSRIVGRMMAGLGVPRSNRDSDVNATGLPSFRLGPPHAPSSELLMSAEGKFPVSIPVRLQSSRTYGLGIASQQLLLGMILGLCLLAFASNSILAISLRSGLYAKYAGFVGGFTMLFLGHEGLTTLYFWGDSPWWSTRELDFYGGTAAICYGLFVCEFLCTKTTTPVLNRLLQFVVGLSTLRMVWMLIHPFWVAEMIGTLSLFSLNVLVLVIAARAWRKSVRTAPFFLLAAACWNAGYMLFILQNTSVLYLGEWVEWAPMIGVTLEISLLSFALADRIGQVDRELVQQRSAVVQADKLSALGRMAGEIAHEINNPLAIIHGNAALIKSLDASPVVTEYATTIEVTAKRISNLVRGMRTLARNTRQDPFQPTPFSVVLQDALLLCRDRVRQVELDVQQPEQDPTLRCRSSEISQVLVNLMNNAFDAVEGSESPRVQVAAALKGDNLEISVCDSGPGVPHDLRARIQEPFFTTKEAGKGLGLGLSISRTIVENHGGALWLDEKSDRTRFAFTVPVSR